jgi:hypothetical protein
VVYSASSINEYQEFSWGWIVRLIASTPSMGTSYTTNLPSGRPSLRSSGQSSWLQIRRSGFDSRPYQIFWGVLGLKRGPLCLVSTTEKLVGRKSSGSDLEIREYGRRDPLCWPRDNPYPQKVGTNFTDKRTQTCRVSPRKTKGSEPKKQRSRILKYLKINIWRLLDLKMAM